MMQRPTTTLSRAEITQVMDAAVAAFQNLSPRGRVARMTALGRRWKVTSSAFRIFAEEVGGDGNRLCRWY